MEVHVARSSGPRAQLFIISPSLNFIITEAELVAASRDMRY
jgi:hypothetical protein